jgi:hypothetical protein
MTLGYLEYLSIPVREATTGEIKRPTVRTHITTNEYIDISKKKFLTHIQKLTDISKSQELSPEIDEKPSPEALYFAQLVIEQLQKDELAPEKVIESVDGGVAFCFVAGDKYADIECLNTGEILGVTTNRRDRPSVWEVQQNQSEIARATERIREFICAN